MKTPASRLPEAVVSDDADRNSGPEPGSFRRALGIPGQYWLRLGERLFHYQLLRAQMLERAFMPDDRCGESR